MRTIAQINREIEEAEAKASDAKLAGNKIYTAEQQRRLYQARAEALRTELVSAEKARQAMLRMGQVRRSRQACGREI